MIEFEGIRYLDRQEVKDIVKLTRHQWEKWWPRFPFKVINAQDYYPQDKIYEIRDLLDPEKYYTEARAFAAVGTYRVNFRKHAHALAIEKKVHPLLLKVLYSKADVQRIHDSVHAPHNPLEIIQFKGDEYLTRNHVLTFLRWDDQRLLRFRNRIASTIHPVHGRIYRKDALEHIREYMVGDRYLGLAQLMSKYGVSKGTIDEFIKEHDIQAHEHPIYGWNVYEKELFKPLAWSDYGKPIF
jgi:hypothetical protein